MNPPTPGFTVLKAFLEPPSTKTPGFSVWFQKILSSAQTPDQGWTEKKQLGSSSHMKTVKLYSGHPILLTYGTSRKVLPAWTSSEMAIPRGPTSHLVPLALHQSVSPAYISRMRLVCDMKAEGLVH